MNQIVAFAAVLAIAAAYPTQEAASSLALEKRMTPFNFAVLGDSYASGVSYGALGRTNYDDNKSGCMRINHAYAAQLPNSLAETTYGFTPTLTFAACSGSVMADIVNGRHQMDQVAKNTSLIIMQIGGNNAHFFEVVSNCIFQQNHPAGTYPGGDCGTALANAGKYIHGAKDAEQGKSLYVDMKKTLSDALGHPRANDNEVFQFYVLGYPHFFDTRPGSDWCNKITFNVYSKYGQPLVNGLRSDINALTSDLNNQIQSVVADLKDSRLRFVQTTDAFNGHRFCQSEIQGGDKDTQYFGDWVWFWNANLADVVGAESDPKQAAIDKTWNETYLTKDAEYNAASSKYNWVDLLNEGKGVNALSPNQDGTPGSALRPFHPKKSGHTAIMNAIRAQFLKDFYFPGQPTAPVCNPAFEGHKDMHEVDLISWSGALCLSWLEKDRGAKSELSPDDPPQGATYNGPSDSKAGMRFVVSWVPGCVAGSPTASIYYPMGNQGLTCPDIFKQDYEKCNNGGVGGYIDVGCLRYRYDGGV